MSVIKNRKILDDGTVICDKSAILELLYENKSIYGAFINDAAESDIFADANRICDTEFPAPIFADSEKYSDINWIDHWTTPEEYTKINLKEWCYAKCKSDEEKHRVDIEISEFEARNMIPIMQHLIYCTDVWRKNNVVWGVGRGSSVSSFVLYLIGINRINPLKYNLDLKEWLK